MMIFLEWYIAGPLIGLMVPVLLILREKQLGLSSTYRYFGSFVLPRNSYFNYQRKNDAWQVHFAIGIVLAALIVFQFGGFEEVSSLEVSSTSVSNIYSLENWFVFALGGLLVGFGARYAGGCTAGHCIMGNSLFSVSSLIATLMFFGGGLLVSHFVLPQLLNV